MIILLITIAVVLICCLAFVNRWPCGEHPSVARHCGSRNCLFCPRRRL